MRIYCFDTFYLKVKFVFWGFRVPLVLWFFSMYLHVFPYVLLFHLTVGKQFRYDELQKNQVMYLYQQNHKCVCGQSNCGGVTKQRQRDSAILTSAGHHSDLF